LNESRATAQAIGLVCLSGLLFVSMNALVKDMMTDHHPVMLMWARYFFHVLTVVALFPMHLRGVWRTPQMGTQVGRSILLLLSTVFNFLALGLLPLGEVAAITFTSPILVAFLAVLVLREHVGIPRWLAIGVGFVGALVVVRPLGAEFNIGSVLAFGCAAAYALYQISTRIVREAEPIVSLFFSGLVGMIALSAIVPFFWEWPSLADWGLFAIIGSVGGIGHLLIIMALQRAEASKVSPFTYVQLVWAMVAGFIVFGDVPDVWTLLGAGVIVASGLWVFQLDQRKRGVPAIR
jgi:drug/metabolite transporter (DMT)-like permease